MSYFITEDCIICGTCFEICPTRSVVNFEWYYKIDEGCAECGACIKVCPNTAIRTARPGNAKKREDVLQES